MSLIDPATGDPYKTPCTQNDPELWFSNEPEEKSLAHHLCSTCPAIKACLELGLSHEEEHGMGYRHGIWGNTNPADRARLDSKEKSKIMEGFAPWR